MLASKNQLKKEEDIKKVFKKGKVFKEDFLILRLANNSLKNSRFGFIVSKKVSKKASLRNKLKRRLREAVRVKIKKIKTDIDGLLIAAPGLERRNFWEIDNSINKIFLRAKLFDD